MVEGYRPSSEQDALYAKGRDANGNVVDKAAVVTYARGGQSYHNYGLAIDVAVTSNGATDFTKPITPAIAQYAKAQGFTWGGDFTGNGGFVDYPHFEMTFGQSWQSLQQKSNP